MVVRFGDRPLHIHKRALENTPMLELHRQRLRRSFWNYIPPRFAMNTMPVAAEPLALQIHDIPNATRKTQWRCDVLIEAVWVIAMTLSLSLKGAHGHGGIGLHVADRRSVVVIPTGNINIGTQFILISTIHSSLRSSKIKTTHVRAHDTTKHVFCLV